MSVTVRLPSVLWKHTDGEKLLELESESVGELLASLVRSYPGLGESLMVAGKLHDHVNVYVNDEDIRYLSKLETVLSDGDTLSILPALSGGGR